ncbi:MAG: hypothetical protein RI894_18 [Bacteroidota bacterium]
MLNLPLINRIFEGDKCAVATLHRTMRQPVLLFLQKRGVDDDRAADIYAESCTVLLEAYYHGKLKPQHNIEGFLMATAKNLLYSEQRQTVRYGATVPDDYDEPDDLLDALDNMVLQADILKMANALLLIKDGDRNLLVQHAVEGIPLATLARAQQENENTVRQRFNRALFKLKAAIC